MTDTPAMAVVEQYLPGKKVKHLAPSHNKNYGLCGQGVMWFEPESRQWQRDKETLNKLRLCKKCEKLAIPK